MSGNDFPNTDKASHNAGLADAFHRAYGVGPDFGLKPDAVGYCRRIVFAENRRPLVGAML
jgi:hypothetical protein